MHPDLSEADSLLLGYEDSLDEVSGLLTHWRVVWEPEVEGGDRLGVVPAVLLALGEGQLAEEHLEQQHAHAPDVDSLVVGLLYSDLVAVVAGRACLADPLAVVRVAKPGGQPKVTDADVEVRAFNQNVLRLDIAMHDAFFVDDDERLDHLGEHDGASIGLRLVQGQGKDLIL